MGKGNNYAIINMDTGEIVQKIKGKTQDVTRQQYDFLKRREKLCKNYNQKFIWVLYDGLCEYYPDIKPQSITKLMYIVTYLGYKGYLAHDNHNIITKKDIYTKLNISRQQGDRFYKEMIQNDIFIEQDSKIYINESCFCRGDIEKTIKYRKGVTRIFSNNIRMLYKNTPISHHGRLGYLFKTIPYAHKQYNILCKNPYQEKFSQINPLSLDEFCDIIHYTKTNKRILIQEICKNIHINKQPLISYEAYKNSPSKLFINPNLFYAGDNPKAVNTLGRFTLK